MRVTGNSTSSTRWCDGRGSVLITKDSWKLCFYLIYNYSACVVVPSGSFIVFCAIESHSLIETNFGAGFYVEFFCVTYTVYRNWSLSFNQISWSNPFWWPNIRTTFQFESVHQSEWMRFPSLSSDFKFEATFKVNSWRKK